MPPKAPAATSSTSRSGWTAYDELDPRLQRKEDAYYYWKYNIPLLYDCIYNQNLEWPAYACAWAQMPGAQGTIPGSSDTSYTFYYSRSTDCSYDVNEKRWMGLPNMINIAEVRLPAPRTSDILKQGLFNEESNAACITTKKRLVHPGEVNRIKVCHSATDIIATHTDSPLVYVWNCTTQPGRRSSPNVDVSRADLTCTGHENSHQSSSSHVTTSQNPMDSFYYALDWSRQSYWLASGGSDLQICIWNIEDYVSGLSHTSTVVQPAPSSAKKKLKPPPTTPSIETHTMLSPRYICSGHTATVEDVTFHPENPSILASVGDDRFLRLFDTRAGIHPTHNIITSHSEDVNCVSWNHVNTHLIITGSSDHTVKLIDLRRGEVNSVLHTYTGHQGNVTNVSWSPTGTHIASCSEDCFLHVYDATGAISRITSMNDKLNGKDDDIDMDKTHDHDEAMNTKDVDMNMTDGEKPVTSSRGATFTQSAPSSSTWTPTFNDALPSELLFRHAGHRTAIVTFAWNPYDLHHWTFASLSDDSVEPSFGGGTLQIYRVSDQISRPRHEVLQEFREFNATGKRYQPIQTHGTTSTLTNTTTTIAAAAAAAAVMSSSGSPKAAAATAILSASTSSSTSASSSSSSTPTITSTTVAAVTSVISTTNDASIS